MNPDDPRYQRQAVNQCCEQAQPQALRQRETQPHEAAMVMHTKQWRAALDAVLQDIKQATAFRDNGPRPQPGAVHLPICRNSDERQEAAKKIKEAIMWLGLDLKALNDGQTCYPDGYDASNARVNPVPDGVKF